MIYPVFSIASIVFTLSVPAILGLNTKAKVDLAEHLSAAGEITSRPSFCAQEGWNHEWGDEFLENKLSSDWAPVTSAENQGDESAPVSGLGVTACRSAKCRPENVILENGQLILRSDRDPQDANKYYTGAVTTRGLKNWKDDTPYRLCVSAKLPGAGRADGSRGIWPAHWMLPDNGLSDKCLDEGEVDIMEMINGDGGAYSTYHYMTSFPNITCGDFNKYHKSRNTLTNIPHYHNNFHEYAIERSKDYINYAIDGRVVHHVPAKQLKTPLSHSPFFLIMNTAVGGAWPGEPIDETHFPTEHVIDYVRVARRSEDAPEMSLLSYPLGRSADDIGTADLAKSASWADAWHPSSFLEAGASFGPPPSLSMAHLENPRPNPFM